MRHISQDPNLRKEDLRKVEWFVGISVLLLFLYILGWVLLYSIYDALVIMGLAFFGMVPAFLTNALMPLVANIKGIKRYPLDFGKCHKDGERILGEGKSWNGLIFGTIIGFILSALISSQMYPYIAEQTIINFADGETVLRYVSKEKILFFVDVTSDPVKFYLGQFLLCLGTPFGDAIGSYAKRRRKLKRGEVFLFWDQNNFIIAAIIIAYFFFPIQWYYIVFLLLVTPLITVTANILGYYIGKKQVPW
jgi:CDP-2,3-bis-(O-geranylgeranyl)-sn-glycerol synthase